MRRNSKTIQIGNIKIGGTEPVMIQSMLNTDTMDTQACVEQAVRVYDAGGMLVRITAQGVREAANLQYIRTELTARGYTLPLSADIHFVPEAALEAAKHVEKVRINPGNFIDKRAIFQKLSYTDEEYATELQRLRSKFVEFLNICREYGTAVRIGTNHGSLSDRIMSRYGDTPAGMVEATMEYLRVCRDELFDNVVISLKSSDCRVMVESVRLLVAQMEKEGMNYPLHLGVTEAGEGEDGRIRSAVGIGTLLCEGIGDTIRVSLTEAPESEIPVAMTLAVLCQDADYRPMLPLMLNVCAKPAIVSEIDGGEYQFRDGRLYQNEEERRFVEINETTDLSAFTCDPSVVVVIRADNHRLFRDALSMMTERKMENERILCFLLRGDRQTEALKAAAHVGGFFLDRAAHALWIDAEDKTFALQLSRDILQSAGCRRYKTEFVSCPGCGRTLYDLQTSVKRVKAAFSKYKNLKIAIMGCIVNGPGEMGDADFGYVGAGNGKVNLYKGYECMRRAVPEEEAIEALRQLIEENIEK